MWTQKEFEDKFRELFNSNSEILLQNQSIYHSFFDELSSIKLINSFIKDIWNAEIKEPSETELSIRASNVEYSHKDDSFLMPRRAKLDLKKWVKYTTFMEEEIDPMNKIIQTAANALKKSFFNNTEEDIDTDD